MVRTPSTQPRVDAPDLRLHRPGDRVHVAVRADFERADAIGLGVEHEVHRRSDVGAKVEDPGVGDHADDFVLRCVADAGADGVLAGEIAAGPALGDGDDAPALREVGVRERASAQHGDAHRLEERRADVGAVPGLVVGQGAPGQGEARAHARRLHHAVADGADRPHAGDGCHTFEQLPLQRTDPTGAVAGAAGVERHLQQAIRIEADVDARQVAQRLDEQAGPDQQQHRQRHLAGDQPSAEATAGLGRAATGAGAQDRRESPAAARQAGARPNRSALTSEAAAANARIRASRRNARASGGAATGSIDSTIDTPQPATTSASPPPSAAEHQTLDGIHQQQATTSGPERDPHRQLAAPPGIAHHEQVADVDTGDEKHDDDQGRDGQQRPLVLVAQARQPASGRDERGVHVVAPAHRVRGRRRELTEDHFGGRLRAIGFDAGRDAGEHPEHRRRARDDPAIRRRVDRQSTEWRRSDADDRVGLAVHRHRPAERVGPGVEAPAPPGVADDNHGVVGRRRHSAEARGDPQVGKEVGGHAREPPLRLRHAVDRDDRSVDVVEPGHRVEESPGGPAPRRRRPAMRR